MRFSRGHLLPCPEFERHAAEDQAGEDEEKGDIEVAEQEGIGRGEGGEGSAAGRDQPDLVAVPNRADGVQEEASVRIGTPEKGIDDAHPQIEAVGHEIGRPQDAPQGKPDYLMVHGCPPIARCCCPSAAMILCP
jgi:hypothetical protein